MIPRAKSLRFNPSNQPKNCYSETSEITENWDIRMNLMYCQGMPLHNCGERNQKVLFSKSSNYCLQEKKYTNAMTNNVVQIPKSKENVIKTNLICSKKYYSSNKLHLERYPVIKNCSTN